MYNFKDGTFSFWMVGGQRFSVIFRVRQDTEVLRRAMQKGIDRKSVV